MACPTNEPVPDTSVIPRHTESARPGRARVTVRRCSRTSSGVFPANCHHGSPSASRASMSRMDRTHGGFPTCRSKPPRAKTGAKSSCQWKNPCSRATWRHTCSHGCLSRVCATVAAPALARARSSWAASASQIWAEPSMGASRRRSARLRRPPSSIVQASIHSAQLGGATWVVSGQNHRAHQASMTSRSRW